MAVLDTFSLKDKAALVTGGAGLYGRQILRAVAEAGLPPIVPRSGWGADESIRRNEPEVASSVRFAIVHHTAGPNTYSPSQAAAWSAWVRTLSSPSSRTPRSSSA